MALIDTFLLLEALVMAALLSGLLGLILRRNLFLKILAMDVMGTASVALFVLVAARSGLRTPIGLLLISSTEQTSGERRRWWPSSWWHCSVLKD